MKREELLLAARKAILENAHNSAVPAVVQVWQNQKLPDTFPMSYEYLGRRLNQLTRKMQHVYNLDAHKLLKLCESK